MLSDHELFATVLGWLPAADLGAWSALNLSRDEAWDIWPSHSGLSLGIGSGSLQGPKVNYSSYAALTVKSRPPRSANGNPAARSIADLAPFRYHASWKNSRL
jgi:hypothetical protein